MSNIEFDEHPPWRSPEVPLLNFKHLFINKNVVDLGCGSGDAMLYIRDGIGCNSIIGYNFDLERSKKNRELNNLNIIGGNFLEKNFEGKDTYFLWIETSSTEVKVLQKLTEYKKHTEKKCNVIIAYSISGSCLFDKTVPNENKKWGGSMCKDQKGAACRYRSGVGGSINKLESFLVSNSFSFEKKKYNYNNGNGCRESGEMLYFVINI